MTNQSSQPPSLAELAALAANDQFIADVLKTPCEKKLDEMLTCYEPLILLKKTILKLALANLPVLILGETGTGKELVAEALHISPQRLGKFVPVNCAGIPSELLESEFFGSVKGAFTGAENKTGYVKEAENGTLFLDEIGDMPSILQSKILRVLETKRYRRVGTTTEEVASFRLVSATNKVSIDCPHNSSFREDLYYRLCGTCLRLPPLRERGVEDIKLLVDRFTRPDKPALKERILADLAGKDLKGNIRQLRNIIEEHNVLYE